MAQQTRGTIEAEIANLIVRYHREQQGRGPKDVRAYLIGDMLLVRCSGIFTQTEAHLSATEEGRRLIRSARQEMRAISHLEVEKLVANVVDCQVLRSYSDVNVQAEEQVEVYILGADLERRLLRNDLDRLSTIPGRNRA